MGGPGRQAHSGKNERSVTHKLKFSGVQHQGVQWASLSCGSDFEDMGTRSHRQLLAVLCLFEKIR